MKKKPNKRFLTEHEVAHWFERLEKLFTKRLPKPHHTATRRLEVDADWKVGKGRVRVP